MGVVINSIKKCWNLCRSPSGFGAPGLCGGVLVPSNVLRFKYSCRQGLALEIQGLCVDP